MSAFFDLGIEIINENFGSLIIFKYFLQAGTAEIGSKMEADQAKKEAEQSKKTSIKGGPWDVCKKVFSQEDHKTMSFIDKSIISTSQVRM